jgi:glycosyltransferase involved in cell wall biosynthesis
MAATIPAAMSTRPPVVLIAARNEAERLPATLRALAAAFPGAHVVVADDGSTDATAQLARDAGAEVVRSPRPLGKGGAATLAARAVLDRTTAPDPPLVLLCDADLGDSAQRLAPLLDAVERGDADLAVAVFARRIGGGFGLAVGAARRAITRATGLQLQAPLSGQRALRGEVLACVVPFADGFGMEVGMTIDAARAGFRIGEVEVDLEHRATGRTIGGFAHRARQLRDLVLAAVKRS